jgi:hypothetical protein
LGNTILSSSYEAVLQLYKIDIIVPLLKILDESFCRVWYRQASFGHRKICRSSKVENIKLTCLFVKLGLRTFKEG